MGSCVNISQLGHGLSLQCSRRWSTPHGLPRNQLGAESAEQVNTQGCKVHVGSQGGNWSRRTQSGMAVGRGRDLDLLSLLEADL